MKQKSIAVGLDFGTESGRILLVDATTGGELISITENYPHGVMDEMLPDGKTKLGQDWALQHPMDYLTVTKKLVKKALAEAAVQPEEIIGIGVDFTSCTILPATSAGTPLCELDEFKSNPHAWVKLWKHHAAQPEADEINELAEKRGEDFLKRYGGKISSEWLIPKALQILHEAPEIYDAADRIIEAGDWLVWQLTGSEKRSACQAGYKALWDKEKGYPSGDFFKALDPRFEHIVADKLSEDIYPIGSPAGKLTAEMAGEMELPAGIPVGIAIIDAHAAVLGSSVAEEGKMVLVLGTSNCHMVLSRNKVLAEGIAGIVEDGILPGFVGYESGQSAVGDIFNWFIRNYVPDEYYKAAEQLGVDIYKYLELKAMELKPGESGLLALDWWNGNRSVLMDGQLSGCLMGLTLSTKPEEIYRALIEATAFGTRKIIDNHHERGVAVNELYACGGLAEKNPLLLQIYADVTGRDIHLAASQQAAALGAAIIGAIAAGKENGGYDDFIAAAKKMARLKKEVYCSNKKSAAIYAQLYAEYLKLHDYFGRSVNDVMKKLRKLAD
ncbi:MAG TPA: ribulokinase [Bacteroidetes bacterium]|nr:ribulokinase [Bacteroidota bacterium]